jgi:predicted homoserine dehydrogenase-like protein
MSWDKILQELETSDKPIRVGLVGAGATGRAISLHLATPVPGIRLVAIANRTEEHAKRAFQEAGIIKWTLAKSAKEAQTAITHNSPVITSDPLVLANCEDIDVIVEATGTIEPATRTVLDAFKQRKHVVLVNAELDSLLGPILKIKADKAKVILTNTDGDEPGVAMTLLRYLRAIGLRPVAAGNLKGIVDYYRTPDTQKTFAEKNSQNPRKVTSFADATKLSMETTVLANATGFQVGRRGMYGPTCTHVQEMAHLLPPEKMLKTGLVDYALGAAPYTGAFVIIYENSLLKKTQLAYYKLGQGPFYVFYTPYHLPHIQIASTIARAVIHNDPTVAPVAGPVCEVVAMAKRNLKSGELLDGIGGFCTYGLIDNSLDARKNSALPIGLSEGCQLRQDIPKDSLITLSDVTLPKGKIAEELWHEQGKQWQQL